MVLNMIKEGGGGENIQTKNLSRRETNITHKKLHGLTLDAPEGKCSKQ